MIPVIASNVPTVVAMTGPGSLLTPWRDQVDAILHGFFPGEEYGNALADVLFGTVNPSGRLPVTMPNIDNEIGFSRAQYPGIAYEGFYSEQMFVDYRWYTAHNVTPAFPFGHGLSYTTFEYTELNVASCHDISVSVKNTGSRAGSDVVQLYVEYPTAAQTPPLQLKGFVKSQILQPGDKEAISFRPSAVDLSVWSVDHTDMGSSHWYLVPGTYKLWIGSSSADKRLSGSCEII